MKVWVFKSGSKLVPCTSDDKDKIAKLPKGEPFMISYTKVRNPYHLRKYFAFLKAVYNNLPERYEENFPDFESFRKSVQMYAGYYTETISLKGERLLMPKSIAYNELDEMAFSDLHSKVKTFIGTKLLPEFDMQAVEREIDDFY
jgi:hypothetical protein